MPLVACNCTNCGAQLEVDDSNEKAVCQFCGTPFIVEKAINYYKTVNVTMDQKDEAALVRKGLRMLDEVYFNARDLYDLADTLGDIAKNDFYPELFLYACGKKDNYNWLYKNSKDDEKKILAKYLFNSILRAYNKESFSEFERVNLVKNYGDLNFRIIDEDNFSEPVRFLSELKDYFDSDMNEKWEKLQTMINKELSEEAKSVTRFDQAAVIYSCALSFSSIAGDIEKEEAKSAARAYLEKLDYTNINKDNVFSLIQYLESKGEDVSFFKLKIGKDSYVTTKEVLVGENRFAVKDVLRMTTGTSEKFILVRISSDEATIVRIPEATSNRYFVALLPDCVDDYNESTLTNLADYKSEYALDTGLKLVYKEGLSYKPAQASNPLNNALDKAKGFFKKLFK